MNPLPYDIARCAGRMNAQELGTAGIVRITTSIGQAECVRCRRREPGHPERQTHMSPPQFVDGRCPERIKP